MDERAKNGEIEEVQALQAEVERLTREVERNWQQFLQTAADLENYRKHAIRQREEAVAVARRTMFGIILGVVDTLDRAVEHTLGHEDVSRETLPETIAYGIELARRKVLETLATMGVRPMETVGRPFDPRLHEAVEGVPARDGAAPGTVVGEVQRGYLLGDDVLRPARVRVAQ
jgi:molecular chaperone GrpE